MPVRFSHLLFLSSLTLSLVTFGCGDDENDTTAADTIDNQLEVGPEGGTLRFESGPMQGVVLEVPEGAAIDGTKITVTEGVDPEMPLIEGAYRVGMFIDFKVDAGELTAPIRVTLPFDPAEVTQHGQEPAGVKVWRIVDGAWTADNQIASSADTVTIEPDGLDLMAAGVFAFSIGE